MIKEKDKYRLLIENLPDGVAYCKMVRDNTGKPLDYIFLEVNSSFEALTGLPRDYIIGKKLTEIRPGVEDLSFDWIGVFEQVRIIKPGQNIRFQQYLNQQDRWHEITVYSDQPGYFAVVFRDITKNKKAEEELQQCEKNFFTLVENNPDMIIRFNLDLQLIYVNAAVKNQFGVPVHRFIGKTFLEIDGPSEQFKSMHQVLKKALKTGKEQQIEQNFPLPSGQKYFQTRIVPERDEKGRIESLLAVTRDITKHKQAEEKLSETKEYLGNLIKYANAPIMVWDTSLSITRFNRAFENLSGFDASEVIGRKIEILFSKDKIGSALEHIKKTSSGERWETVEIEIQRKDGEPRIVLWNSANILDTEKKNVIATIAQGQDITERKQAEKALQESDKIFKQFMENSPNYVFFKNDKIQAIRLSRNYEKMLGKPMHELLGKTMDDLFPSDLAKSMIADDLRVLNEGKQVTVEEELNGRFYTTIKFPILVKGKPRYLAGYTMDITERKQMERELIHSERMAIAGQLAAGVAHEFNNLLSIIGGSAEYAKGIRNENEIKKSLDVIVKSANRGAQVVKKLLMFTKRIELKKESVDLIEVIEEVVGLVKRDLENNSITVVRNYSDIPKTLIDVGQIQQVFLNLIINAKNAMSKGGKLAINVEKEGKFIKIQFHNTGKTINKEDLPRLFTPFFATSMRQKEGMPGTGLGLAVSYGIIKAHNGVIKAESVKGKGTPFTILLSVTKNENMAEVLPKAVAEAAKNNKRKLKQAEILIVDDEVEIGKLFKKVLDEEGYSVTVTDSGGNALNLCRKKKYDLIYLDIIMPGMDGIFVFKKIKEISPKTKIVFFTGKLIEDKVAGMCLDEGAAGFLRKPIPLKDLVNYTQNILKDKNE